MLPLVLFTSAQAETFWVDDFENHLTPNWDTSACIAGTSNPPPQDGCNPTISTDVAHSGTHSLKAHYDESCGEGTCGTYYDRYHPATRDLWARFWYRTAPGSFYATSMTKHIRFSDETVGGYPKTWIMHFFGGKEFGFAVENIMEKCPFTPFPPPDSCNYLASSSTGPYTPVPIENDRWYCIETHIKYNSSGTVADGVLEIFVDGVRSLNYTNRLFTGTTVVGNNHPNAVMTTVRPYAQAGHGDMYYDDLAVGNTRIGCAGSAVTSQPASPSGLAIK